MYLWQRRRNQEYWKSVVYPNLIITEPDAELIVRLFPVVFITGLDVKGPFPDVKYRLKGEQPLTAEFTMKDETRITSWWPSSGVKKATLTVEVEK